MAALVSAGDGNGSANYEYDPFGQTIRATGVMASENAFRFSTKRLNDATDSLLYERRCYSASAGRWLSRDPIDERGGGNLYGFVGNSQRVDRHGLATLRYIDVPKWWPIGGWTADDIQEFLWVGHYLTTDAADALALSDQEGYLLVRHRSEAVIVDCHTGAVAGPRSRDWFFEDRIGLARDGHLLWGGNAAELFTDGAEHMFGQIGSFSMRRMLQKYAGKEANVDWTRGWIHSRMEFHLIAANAYDVESERWDRSPARGYDDADIDGHELGREHQGRMAVPPMSWFVGTAYAETLDLNFKWNNCCGTAKWDFRCSPPDTEAGAQRFRYRNASWPGSFNLLERRTSGNW